MLVTNNVYKLECTKGAYVYAVTGENGVTLIDACFPGRGRKILAELLKAGIKPADVKHILMTHNDIDHIGSLAYLQENTGCEIYIHSLDYPVLMEGARRDGAKAALGTFLKVKRPGSVIKLNGNNKPVNGIEAIFTPGHTRGHCAYKYGNVLFVGDLVNTKNGKVGMLGNIMNWDPAQNLASIKNIPLKGVEWICPAHGGPVKVSALKEFLSK